MFSLVSLVFLVVLSLSFRKGAPKVLPTPTSSGLRALSTSANQTGSLGVAYVTIEGKSTQIKSRNVTYLLGSNETLDIARNSDDVREIFTLPWPFPYFGQDRDYLYVDANGALHFTQGSVCVTSIEISSEVNSQVGCFCNSFDDGFYMDTIGGIFADLNPLELNTSRIQFQRGWRGEDDEVVEFTYSGVPFYGSGDEDVNTFRIVLSTSGRIDIIYDDVGNLQLYKHEYVSGLRPPAPYSAPSREDAYKLTEQQLCRSSNTWKVGSGVYPNDRIDSLQAGNQFTACPISLDFCAQNSSIYIGDELDSFCDGTFPNLGSITIELTPASLSCVDLITFGVTLRASIALPPSMPVSSPTPGPTSFMPTSAPTSSSCAPESTVEATDVGPCEYIRSGTSLACDITTLVTNIKGDLCNTTLYSKITSGANYELNLVWAPISSEVETFTVLDVIEYVPITFLNTTTNTSTAVCEDNFVSNSSSDGCKLCKGSVEDFNVPCENATYEVGPVPYDSSWSTISRADIFRYRDCTGMCYGDFRLDGLGVDCCSDDEMDCFGICEGGGRITTDTDGIYYCCKAESLDCNGICGGPSKRDVCGDCFSTVTDVAECHNALIIETGLDNETVLQEFDLSSGVELAPSVDTPILITNRDEEQNFSFAWVTNNVAKGPSMTIPLAPVYTIKSNETLKLWVNASLGLFGEIEEKVLRINFVVKNDGSVDPLLATLNHDITFITVSSGCSYYHTNYLACVANPTCMFCPLDNSMRVLRAGNRSLLNTVTPNILGPPTEDENGVVYGLCTDLWQMQGCLGVAQGVQVDSLDTEESSVINNRGASICMLLIGLDVFFFIVICFVLLFPRFRRSCVRSVRRSCGLAQQV